MAIECPEEQNELKKNQLRQLALLNGTLREEEQVREIGASCVSLFPKNDLDGPCAPFPLVLNVGGWIAL